MKSNQLSRTTAALPKFAAEEVLPRSRAYELLADQPTSVVGLIPIERDRIVITAIADESGHEMVVSRFGDDVWDLTSLIDKPNVSDNKKLIRWSSLRIPETLLGDVKAGLYAWFKRGKPSWRPASASTLAETVRQGVGVLRYLRDKGIASFAELRPLHLADHINSLRNDRKLSSATVLGRLRVVDVCAHFNADMSHPFQLDPWGGQPFSTFCEHSGLEKREARTPVIPPHIQAALFRHCENVLAGADEILSEVEAGAQVGNRSLDYLAIRDAALYVLLITTGMRISEATGVKKGSWRTEVRGDQVFHWVATIEFKTNKGRVEFLATPETIHALEVVERWSRPLRRSLEEERAILEDALQYNKGQKLMNGMTRTIAVQRLATVRSIEGSMFLGYVSHKRLRVDVLSTSATNYRLRKMGERAGVSWAVANHQCRRTFAWLIAQSRLGSRSLIFLKWQYKHSNMSMTELYASNPLQDSTLFDEVFAEIVSAKSRIVADWFDESRPLSGGGGRKIMQMRSIPAENRASLLAHTAAHVNLRATGHGWCLAEQRGCVGEGWYEYSRCVNCSTGVIDHTHLETWHGIHNQNLELLKIKDCGPAVLERAQREVEKSAQVLRELKQ